MLEKFKTWKRVIISIIIAVVSIFGGIKTLELMAKLKKEPDNKESFKAFITVKVIEAHRTNYVEELKGYGVTRAMSNTVVSSQIPGIIKWISPELKIGSLINFPENEPKKLIEIDDQDLQEIYLSAQSNLEKAKFAVKSMDIEIEASQRLLKNAHIEWETSIRELKRLEKLQQERGISPSDLDKQILQTSAREKEHLRLTWQEKSQQNAKESSFTDIKLKESLLQQAANDLEKVNIYAPYPGHIIEKDISIGTRVAPGSPLFRIINIQKIEVPVSLPASQYNNISIGAHATIQIREANDNAWEGTVARISPSVDTQNKTLQVFLEITQQKLDIPAGILVIANIAGKTHENVFIVPRTAIINKKVFIIERDKKDESGMAIVQEKKIEIKTYSSEYAIVTSGLDNGDQIITTNVEELAAGIYVGVSGN